mmetsp:Transcript_83375/g.193762  ORF Transcript_83375/g.193762 Transcript_83375/m.193762 type:complete len:273 (+) Transcript_83375:58-876(+)
MENSPEIWEVVGGQERGGIIVRTGYHTNSPQAGERLSHGAVVRQLELQGDRLCFQRLSGTGPSSGWVTVSLGKGRILLEHKVNAAASPASQLSTPAEGVRVEYRTAECSIRPYLPSDSTSLFCLERLCFEADDSLLRAWVRDAGDAVPDTFVDVAISCGSSLVGYVAWMLERYSSARPFFKVLSLAVCKHKRGRRIGEQLLQNVQVRGRERWSDVGTLGLTVRADNAPARRLYDRLGFQQVAVLRKKYTDCDGLTMMLKFAKPTRGGGCALP